MEKEDDSTRETGPAFDYSYALSDQSIASSDPNRSSWYPFDQVILIASPLLDQFSAPVFHDPNTDCGLNDVGPNVTAKERVKPGLRLGDTERESRPNMDHLALT